MTQFTKFYLRRWWTTLLTCLKGPLMSVWEEIFFLAFKKKLYKEVFRGGICG